MSDTTVTVFGGRRLGKTHQLYLYLSAIEYSDSIQRIKDRRAELLRCTENILPVVLVDLINAYVEVAVRPKTTPGKIEMMNLIAKYTDHGKHRKSVSG
jgi:hypothetical protein